MAKKRQGIHDIQAALLSHTQYIGGGETMQEGDGKTEVEHDAQPESPSSGCVVPIANELHEKLAALARYQNTTVADLVALAVEDLLALRSRQLQAALDGA